jgi:hypothetical protein
LAETMLLDLAEHQRLVVRCRRAISDLESR